MTIKPAIPDATQRALGQLFAAFKVGQSVGVGFLHKHFKLAQDTIMVHDRLVCKPESIQSSFSATVRTRRTLNLAPNFLAALAGCLESHQLSGQVSLSKLDVEENTSAEHHDPETASKPNHDAELERAVSHSERHKPRPIGKMFMERLDPPTNSRIMEEAPYIVPRERDATQWIFKGGVPRDHARLYTFV